MYALQVFHPGARSPTETLHVRRAAEVLERIPELLAKHHDCERLVVLNGHLRLFAVDCAGNRLEG